MVSYQFINTSTILYSFQGSKLAGECYQLITIYKVVQWWHHMYVFDYQEKVIQQKVKTLKVVMIKTMINSNLLERRQWYQCKRCSDHAIHSLTAAKITTATLQCAWNGISKQKGVRANFPTKKIQKTKNKSFNNSLVRIQNASLKSHAPHLQKYTLTTPPNLSKSLIFTGLGSSSDFFSFEPTNHTIRTFKIQSND